MKIPRLILSEEELVAAITSQDATGAEALYDQYAKSLYGVIARIVPVRELAEDVLQETFLKIWHNSHQYDTTKGRLFTWMVTIARNTAKDLLRSGQYKKGLRTLPMETQTAMIETERQVMVNTDLIGVRSFLTSLKKDQRLIFELIYYKGYTHQEVADRLLIPMGTVKTRWRRGIQTLRAIYNYAPAEPQPATLVA